MMVLLCKVEDVTWHSLVNCILGTDGFCLSSSNRSPTHINDWGWKGGIKCCEVLYYKPLKHHGIAILSATICYRWEQITGVSIEPSARIYGGRTAQRTIQSSRNSWAVQQTLAKVWALKEISRRKKFHSHTLALHTCSEPKMNLSSFHASSLHLFAVCSDHFQGESLYRSD